MPERTAEHDSERGSECYSKRDYEECTKHVPERGSERGSKRGSEQF